MTNKEYDFILKKDNIYYYDYSGMYKLTNNKKYLMKVKYLGKVLDNGIGIKTDRFEIIWYGVGVQVSWKDNIIAPAYYTMEQFYLLNSID